MEELDRLYLAHPENRSPRMIRILRKVDRRRVRRLMQLMGIRSLAPQPTTTKPHPAQLGSHEDARNFCQNFFHWLTRSTGTRG